MRALASRLVPLLPLVVAACGPGATKPPAAAAPPAPPTAKTVPTESPARWALHATRLGPLRARLDLGGPLLFGGDGGERWLDKRDGSTPQPATTLAPEPLVGLAKGPDQGVRLLGESGTVYVASDPLGPIESHKRPSEPLRAPSAGRAAIVAIGGAGLLRTVDAGATWAKVDLPGFAGTLVQVAMSDAGLGVALAAPQRAWVTEDDGATWKAIATPGVGARRVVLDVNGDLMIEGVEASALLKTSPLRFERVARAPKSDGYDLGAAAGATMLGYARAVAQGRGALVGDHYLEAVAEPDDPTRWRVAYGRLGAALEPKKVAELNGCDRVWVGGDEATLYLACDDRDTPGKGGGPGKAKSTSGRASVRLFRSDDEGKSWKDDGTLGSRRADVGHVWVGPDRALFVDGACKRLRSGDCYDAAPLVRPAGAKVFAKVGAKGRAQQFSALAFAPQGGRAYALGRQASGPLLLLSSKNGGRDFATTPLPSVASSDPKAPPLALHRAEHGSVSVDPSGLVVASAQIGADWVVFTSKDEGATVEGARFPFKADGLSMSGKRGFAWARDGRGWETADAGATWQRTAAPAFADVAASDRGVACGTHGCLVGDRATRVGWGVTATSGASEAPASKPRAASALSCATDGEWRPLGALLSAPTAYDAEPSSSARWLALRQDPTKGSVAVLLGKQGPKGLEVKEVSLFGPAPKDTATAILPQIEGAAAIRYAFKREAPKVDDEPKGKDAKKDGKDKKPKPLGGVVEGQKVDVEVAWFVASTGVVHRATIKAAGPLDPRDVVTASKDGPATANVGLLSIAQGGVHVRPFASRPDVPLWFVREGGKLERLPWPEAPGKDAAGAPLSMRLDAVRAGGRSVVLGVAGAQLWTAWANETQTAWDTRAWGLWPDVRGSVEPSWDFTYVTSGGGVWPAVVTAWPGGGGLPAAAWAAPLKGLEADPREAVAMPTQHALTDPPAACAATDASPRVVMPFSRGTRHPIELSTDGADWWLATSFAVLRGSAQAPCVVAYEARPIVRPKADKAKLDENLSAIVPWADQEHAWLFKTTLQGETSVRGLRCAAAKVQPADLAGVEGFDER